MNANSIDLHGQVDYFNNQLMSISTHTNGKYLCASLDKSFSFEGSGHFPVAALPHECKTQSWAGLKLKKRVYMCHMMIWSCFSPSCILFSTRFKS